MKMHYRVLICLLLLAAQGSAQKYQDEKIFTINTSQLKSLRIYNMEGGVDVQGVDGDIAVLEVTRTLETSSKERMEMAKEEIFIDSLDNEGDLYFFIEGPYMNFQIDEDGSGSYNNWNLSQSESKLRHYKLKYAFKWKIKVPRDLEIHIYNHKEPLIVRNMRSRVEARNHHDGVELTGMEGDVIAKSHHGDVVVTFNKNPKSEIIGKSHHGDIKIQVQDGFSGDVSMRSHHGAFYTDLDGERLPPVVKVSEEKGKKTKYKFGENQRYRIGSGGVNLVFRTHHGDVYVTRS